MEENKANLWKTILFFIICFYNVNSADICDNDHKCNNCDYCGKNTKNYQSCSYSNMFCYEAYGMLLLYRDYTYSQFYKNEYIEYFEKDDEIKSFCGETEFSTGNGKGFTIFDSQDKIFPKNKNIHCHYILNLNGESNYPVLEFKISKNEKVNEDKNLKFKISNFITYNSKEELKFHSYTDIKTSPLKYTFTEAKKIEIFIDFLESSYNQPEEVFQIIVNVDKEEEESTNSNGAAIGGGIAGVVGFIIIIGIVGYCCSSSKSYSGNARITVVQYRE